MSEERDEMMEVLDDILDNGTAIPARVTNRMLLAAVRKNYRMSSQNAGLLMEYYVERAEILGEHLPRVSRLEEKGSAHATMLWALSIATIVLISIVTYHTGIGIGWFAVP